MYNTRVTGSYYTCTKKTDFNIFLGRVHGLCAPVYFNDRDI